MKALLCAAALMYALQAQNSPSMPNGTQSVTPGSLGFGVALAFRINIAKPNLVSDASVDANGIVRVNTISNVHSGFMLESHYLFLRFPREAAVKTWGMGPFVAIEPGTDQVINAIGAGWMIDWKLDGKTKGFGLGLGYASIPSAKVLAEGFADGQAAPLDKGGLPLPIAYQTRDKGSILTVLSFTF